MSSRNKDKRKRSTSNTKSDSPKRQKRTSSEGRKLWFIGLLAALLGGVLYLNTLGHDYTLDDFSVIKDNFITKKGISGIPEIWKSEYRYGAWNSPGSLYRPLTSSMFAVEWQLAPDTPALGHALNIILYALTGWMLWVTWRRVLRNYSPYLIAMAVLFFMAHPIHTEVVANIKSRDEILSLLFTTGALYLLWQHFDKKKTWSLLVSVMLYGMALFSKESAITFLAVFPLCVWFFRENEMQSKLLKTGLFAIPAAVYLAVRQIVLSAQSGEETYSILDNFIVGAASTADKFASAVMMCGMYLYKLVFPLELVSDKGYPQLEPIGPADWRFLLSFAVYAAALVWALLNLKKKKFLSFAILFYLITFSLFSNVFYTIGTSYGERVLYLPSLGFCFGLAYVLWKFVGKKAEWKAAQPTAMLGVAGIILLLYSARTIVRNPAWKDSFSLYSTDRPQSPRCAKINYHAGLEEANKSMDEEKTVVLEEDWMRKAIESYSTALELYPSYHDAYGGRGLAYFRLGQKLQNEAVQFNQKGNGAQANAKMQAAQKEYEKAMTDYQEAVKFRPNDAKVWSNMGFIYFQILNDKPKAEEVYRKALQYDPRFVDARRNLGAVMALSGRYDEAIQQFQEGLKYEPENATLWLYLGFSTLDKGDIAGAKPFLDKAVALDPRLQAQVDAKMKM